MVIEKKYHRNLKDFIRDTRSPYQRWRETAEDTTFAASLMIMAGGFALFSNVGESLSDLILLLGLGYFVWLSTRKHALPLKMPAFSKTKDENETSKKPQGILFLGNEKPGGDELWLSGKDAGTHILFLGTTGSGKTEGLKSIVSNALTWGSGFIYIDGKADTDLWASIYALARRFGRDDDLFVLNYLTGNSDLGSVSNTINPFTTGSSSYLTNLLVSLMDEAKGENAMWKGRAVALMGALMPVLTYRRDVQNHVLDVKVILDSISLQSIIRLSRDVTIPDRIRNALSSTYLETLPGYIAAAFDDQGNEAPPGPNDPPRDISTVSQQHNFLSMQFTRALQSLSGDYWHIFGSQVADVTMQDIVLNRRILVVLIPSLEKSADEAANLGKIVTASIKGMMGTTLGSAVEGDWSGVIDNKLSKSNSPFITIFDEVGYYATQGMAVMAAQARSLGFSLVFASQDIPSMEVRVREEARSITANCNLKIFGKLEESLDTQNFFEKTVGKALITEMGGMTSQNSNYTNNYYDQKTANISVRDKAGWSDLRDQVEGEVHLTWQSKVIAGRLFYAAPKRVKAMRVHKLLGIPAPEPMSQGQAATIRTLVKHLRDPVWRAIDVQPPVEESNEINAIAYGLSLSQKMGLDARQSGAMAIAALAAYLHPEEPEPEIVETEDAADVDFGAVMDYDEDANGDTPGDGSETPSLAGPAPLEALPREDASLQGSPLATIPEAAPLVAALPTPDDADLDELLEGLVKPRRSLLRTPAGFDLGRDQAPIDAHPALGPEVSAILKAAANTLAAGLESVTTIGNAE